MFKNITTNTLRLLPLWFTAAVSSTYAGEISWNFSTTTAPSSDTATALIGSSIAFMQNGGTTGLDSSQPSTGYLSASGGNNLNVGSAKSGALNLATSTYFTFTLTPDSGHGVNATSLTFGSRSTSSGPVTLSLFTSFDDFTTALASVSATANSAWALLDFGSFNLTTAPDTALTFRIYGSGGSSTAGSNWRIDDVKVTASAVPEPAVAAALAGVFVLAVVIHRRRRA